MILGIFGFFALCFFRDPDRIPPAGDRAVLSPADGTVIKVEDVEADPFLGLKMRKISIFMSVFNVHVNRAPMSGKAGRIMYFPGKFFNASLDKASKDNEHNAIVLETETGEKIVFVQIAGLIARRIVCWLKPGDSMIRGQRIGLIRFGSRLDVYVPPESAVDVKVGRKVQAGRSILGYLP